MKVTINEKLICIPPHISTTWQQVAFLQSKEIPDTNQFTLIIHLTDGKVVQIPDLDVSLIDIVFSAHMKYLESEKNTQSSFEKPIDDPKTFRGLLHQLTGLSPEQLANMPIRFGLSSGIPGMENLEMAFQHNQEQADSPDLPSEVLEKFANMAKLVLGGELNAFPKPEPHCNCMHCQLARVIHNIPQASTEVEEPISTEDLKFRNWDIREIGKQMYVVTSPFDTQEQYTVYLGKPIGCTCGSMNCEHIEAVLYT